LYLLLPQQNLAAAAAVGSSRYKNHQMSRYTTRYKIPLLTQKIKKT
jgi:hypothetical protein